MNRPRDEPIVLDTPERIARSIMLGPAREELRYLEEKGGEEAEPEAGTADEA